MTFVECIETDQWRAVWPIMRQLREQLSEDEYLQRLSTGRSEGYRLFVLQENKRPIGLIGWRLVHDLASGRSLFVDDLVVDEPSRSGGYGNALIAFAKEQALAERCDAIRLSSNLQRARAHAFYQREGFDRGGYTFTFALNS